MGCKILSASGLEVKFMTTKDLPCFSRPLYTPLRVDHDLVCLIETRVRKCGPRGSFDFFRHILLLLRARTLIPRSGEWNGRGLWRDQLEGRFSARPSGGDGLCATCVGAYPGQSDHEADPERAGRDETMVRERAHAD